MQVQKKITIPQFPLIGEDKRGKLVTLKYCEIFGKETATLVDEEKPAGTYEIQFTTV
jgi:hypothetical protein